MGGLRFANPPVTITVACPSCGTVIEMTLASPWCVPEGYCNCGAHVYAVYDRRDGAYHPDVYKDEADA